MRQVLFRKRRSFSGLLEFANARLKPFYKDGKTGWWVGAGNGMCGPEMFGPYLDYRDGFKEAEKRYGVNATFVMRRVQKQGKVVGGRNCFTD